MTQILVPVLKEDVSWGVNDPKTSKPWLLAKEIAKHLDADEKTKDEVDFLADRISDKLHSALMYYQLIMAADFDKRNISQKRTIYEGLYANLWSFYKGRVQKFIAGMGWDTAFIFCSDKNFEKEAKKFSAENPDQASVINFARKERTGWQTAFGHSRDTAEHSGDYRDGTNSYETKADAKRLFAQVCWSAETWIAFFGSYKIIGDCNVTEINPKATIFDEEPRHIVEHAVMTAQRVKQANRENQK